MGIGRPAAAVAGQRRHPGRRRTSRGRYAAAPGNRPLLQVETVVTRAPRHRYVVDAVVRARASLDARSVRTASVSGREDLVEQGLGLVLVGVLREGELAHQNLARLGEHPLLTGGESALALTPPQVTHYLGDLDHVAGSELLQICLVATGPVRGLFGIRCTQHLEDPVQPVLTDHVAYADELRIVRWHTNSQVALGDLQHQVGLVHAFDLASFDGLDQRGPVMGIDHGVANLERHVTGTPSVAIHANTGTGRSEWRFRRSGHISGLDNSDRNVLRGAPEAGIRRSEGLHRRAETCPSHTGKAMIDRPNVPFCTDPHERVPLLRSAARGPLGSRFPN